MSDNSSQLTKISTTGCLCPGDVVTYECTTAEGRGAIATVWRGSIFSVLCPRDVQEFVVLYGDNTFQDGYNLSCNGEAIFSSSSRVETESADLVYLSQLNVTLTSDVIGKSIECVVDDGMREIIVGSLNITEGTIIILYTRNELASLAHSF